MNRKTLFVLVFLAEILGLFLYTAFGFYGKKVEIEQMRVFVAYITISVLVLYRYLETPDVLVSRNLLVKGAALLYLFMSLGLWFAFAGVVLTSMLVIFIGSHPGVVLVGVLLGIVWSLGITGIKFLALLDP